METKHIHGIAATCLVVSLLAFPGCSQLQTASMGLQMAAPLTDMAGGVLGSKKVIEEVKAAPGPGVTAGQLVKIKRVTLALSAPENSQQAGMFNPMGGGKDIVGEFRDNLSIELMQLGFEVVDKKTRPDAVIKGTVSGGGSNMNMGMAMMGGAQDSKPGITSVSLKIMDPKKDSVLLAMAVTFKGSQPVNVASKALAQSIKDNLSGNDGGQK
jgi:hypothetical protein